MSATTAVERLVIDVPPRPDRGFAAFTSYNLVELAGRLIDQAEFAVLQGTPQ
jgi:hypothetical protein